jgi:hypothetical protein
MAIIQRLVCKCALCAHEWIPAKTKDNPDTDPAKVKRCAACKSARWNADAGPTGTMVVGFDGPTNFPSPGTTEHWTPEQQEAERKMWAAELKRTAATCRHRILVKDCRLCAPVTQ